ncbi:TlpA disulfide reductase family protein [Chitinophaga arvensicola]|uniref:Thiol-disulfide isomerase or thioredoxin n=1 Tax=Chitinophaga arvensicola TaxID=29529 RepID=A0A1I0RAJ5_9BACT|nr:TlpA disulfide reductase family protein [Chitinophaga arvensicola]SEW37852.1 Thiol-disulfide isomerase or thioredoxin [Chitinophaga arvensicola]
MIRNRFLFFSFFLLLVGLTTAVKSMDRGYVIKGHITGVPDGASVKLSYADFATGNEVLGSTHVKEGAFELKGTLSSPRLLSLLITVKGQEGKGTCFFAENGTIAISGAVEDLLDQSAMANRMGTAAKIKVTGSASHDLYLTYVVKKAPLDQQINTLRTFDLYVPEPGTPVKDRIRISSILDSLMAEKIKVGLDFILKAPLSEVSCYVGSQTISIVDIRIADVDKMMQHLTAAADGPLKQQLLKGAVTARFSAVGASFKDFVLQDVNGKSYHLKDHLGKGKYVLLEFWASWCGVCRKSFPHLKECYELYHPAGLEIVAISLDDKKEAWKEAMDKDGTTSWLQLSDLLGYNSSIVKAYGFSGVPVSILYDPEGKVVTRNFRGAWMEKILIGQFGDRFTTHP